MHTDDYIQELVNVKIRQVGKHLKHFCGFFFLVELENTLNIDYCS